MCFSLVSEFKSPIRDFKSTIDHSFCHKENAIHKYTSWHAALRTQIQNAVIM